MYKHRRGWGNSIMHVLRVVVVLSLKRFFASDKEERMRAPKAPWDILVARNDQARLERLHQFIKTAVALLARPVTKVQPAHV